MSIEVVSYGVPHQGAMLSEVSNVLFTFANGYAVSIGMSASLHRCSPRTRQGVNPWRESVEVCVTLPNKEDATREVVNEVLGFDPGDDVAANVSADDVARIIAHVQSLSE